MIPPLVKDPLSFFPRIEQWLGSEGTYLYLRTGRVELGQGIHAALARIAATELGLPQRRVKVINASTAEGPLEGITAGSQSVSSGGTAVRSASVALRSLVLMIAADRLACASDDLSIDEGVVCKDGKPTDLHVLDLVQMADLSVAVESVPIIDVPRSVPDDLPRPEIRDSVTGTPFLQDRKFDNLLHGRVIHPPNVPATLDDIDEAALAARPGIVRVVRDGAFLGVLSDVEWHAIQAATWARNSVTWNYEKSAPDNIHQALIQSNVERETSFEDGDAPAESLQRVVTTVSRPFLAHGSIGPSVAVAHWTGDNLVVWCHSQGIGPLRQALATTFRTDPGRITVHHVQGSGCYGHNGADDVALEAALLARAVPDRPVRLQWSRADEFSFSASGAAMVVEAEARITPQGQIAGMIVRPTSTPHGNRPGSGGQPNLRSASLITDPFPVPSKTPEQPLPNGGGADRNAVPLYALPYQKVEKRLVRSLPYRTSSLRSLGAFGNILAIEALMDDVAMEIGIDPVSLRLDHLEDERASDVIKAAVELAEPRGQGGEGIGWGLGFGQYKNIAGYCAVIAKVEVAEDVRVSHIWSAVDAGDVISHDGVANQIEGGILQAMSWTLKEALPVAEGRVTAETWEDYPILTFSEVPPIDLRILDRSDAPSLGVGEASTGPTAAALSNAVCHALGVRIPDLPLNRDTIARFLLNH